MLPPHPRKSRKAVADAVRTCLGPKAMLKMMLDPMGGISMTNDGHAILREVRNRLLVCVCVGQCLFIFVHRVVIHISVSLK